MADILFSDAKSFEQTVSNPLTECPRWNLVKISEVVSEDKSFKDYSILHMYIDKEQGQITTVEHNFIVNKWFCYFDHML